MLQRVQTIFLLVAIIACGLMLSLPFAKSVNPETNAITEVMAFSIKYDGLDEAPKIPLVPAIGALSSILLVLFVVTLMGYKNRIRQIRLLMIAMLVNLLLVGAVFIIVGKLSGNVSYQVSTYLTLLSMLMITLSNRFIRRDEAKVRAADRLR